MQELVGPQVLVVDDDASMLRMLRHRLEREGYKVATAADGEEGINMVRNEVFNLVIADLKMPKLRGDELARWRPLARPAAIWTTDPGSRTL